MAIEKKNMLKKLIYFKHSTQVKIPRTTEKKSNKVNSHKHRNGALNASS